MPLLTIITITYNAEQYLPRTLVSVARAMEEITQKDEIEYLIIDGASKDNTLKVAQEYSSIITQVVSEPDKGLYDAMNKGQQLASGKYLWFLNAGDEIYNQFTIGHLLKSMESDAGVYYSDAMLVRENGSEVGLRSIFTPHTLPHSLKWKDFDLGMKVCHQAFIARKNVTKSYEIGNLSADIDWEINCLKRSDQVEYLDFILCKYLMGGLSVKNHRKSLIDRFLVLKRHFGLIPTLINHIIILWRGFLFKQRNGKYW